MWTTIYIKARTNHLPNVFPRIKFHSISPTYRSIRTVNAQKARLVSFSTAQKKRRLLKFPRLAGASPLAHWPILAQHKSAPMRARFPFLFPLSPRVQCYARLRNAGWFLLLLGASVECMYTAASREDRIRLVGGCVEEDRVGLGFLATKRRWHEDFTFRCCYARNCFVIIVGRFLCYLCRNISW